MNTASFFDHFYNQAQKNCLLVMDCQGIVINVSASFTAHFGYKTSDITGKSFRILFNESDQRLKKPEEEMALVVQTGQADDENYVVDMKGEETWCSGESILVRITDGDPFIVKYIINLQDKKHIPLFFRDTEELLHKIFASSTAVPMLILDGSMKIENVNDAFLQLFEIKERPPLESRVSDLDHPFWKDPATRKNIINILVANDTQRHNEFEFSTKNGETKKIMMDSKKIDSQSTSGRLIFILITEVTSKTGN